MTDGGAGAATPMMQQYRELKRRYPDHLLLFRLGDFYELFAEDAELGARLLSITLTARQSVPMAGIPHHAAEAYIARLVQAGQKIAICEQMEAPGKGKKLLRRDVVRVVTPGTLTDTAYLAGGANNYLLALAPVGTALGVALLDVSTGEFTTAEYTGPECRQALRQVRVSQLKLDAGARAGAAGAAAHRAPASTATASTDRRMWRGIARATSTWPTASGRTTGSRNSRRTATS